MVARFERELRESDSLGLVVMDGDGTDAIHLDSCTSPLVQMADLVAWSAHVHVDRHAGNEFAWDWYTKHVAERDPNREPQPI